MLLPRWLRRFLLWPLPVLLCWVYLASVPLLLIVAFIVSYKLPGKLRAVRSLGLATVYVFVETAVVVSAFVLWVTSGFGWKLRSERFVALHYRLLGWALSVLVAAGRRLFVLEIRTTGAVRTTTEGPDGPQVELVDFADYDPVDPPPPIIVMSRHAGPADSILLLHELTANLGRRPRIVLKAALQWDPAFDILLNRLPNRFVYHGSNVTAADLVGELAAGMGERDAFVIFPEGGNFTEGRRARAIEHLRSRGHDAAADRAAMLQHTLPPRPGGTLAAFEACPQAAAVFVAHTGLDDIEGVKDLWTAIPDHKVLDMVFRAIPAGDVPADDAARTELLWRAWETIDAWIDTHPLHDL